MESRGQADVQTDSAEVTAPSGPRRKWALTQEAFDRLLAAFDQDRDRAGEKYLEVRGNLTKFFEWRGCPFPEDHADETINRVAKRLAEGEEIRSPAGYCIGVARLLLLEITKERAREQLVMGEISAVETGVPEPEADKQIDCLRSCLERLHA